VPAVSHPLRQVGVGGLELRVDAPAYSWSQMAVLGNVASAVLAAAGCRTLPKPGIKIAHSLRWKQAVTPDDVKVLLGQFERRGEGLVALVAPERLTTETVKELADSVRRRDATHLLLALRERDLPVPHWALLWVARKQNAVLLLDPAAKPTDLPASKVSGRLLPRRLWAALLDTKPPKGQTPLPGLGRRRAWRTQLKVPYAFSTTQTK
jgi:hypothetical protein